MPKLPLISINAAASDELQRTFDITESVAQAIVKYRQEKGTCPPGPRFASLASLAEVRSDEAAGKPRPHNCLNASFFIVHSETQDATHRPLEHVLHFRITTYEAFIFL